MKKKFYFIIVAALMFIFITAIGASAETYYVSADGNDSNTGTSADTPWRSLSKVSAKEFSPGDEIFLRCGDVFEGRLYPKGSGTAYNPITIGSYGNGAKPLINGDDCTGLETGGAVGLYNQEYWTIQDIEVTNAGTGKEYKMGISVYCEDMIAHGYTIKNVTVHDVNGGASDSQVRKMNDSHWSGGIIIRAEATTAEKETYIDGVLIENCDVYSVARTAITVVSNWNSPIALQDDSYAVNVVIRNNIVHDIDGDGIIATGVDGGIVEHNVAYDTNMMSLKGTPAANIGIWSLHSKNCVFRFNESYLCHTTHDGYGYDIDGDCENVTFEYNYSHDNDGGFILLVNYRNRDLTVRYNISQNDHQFGIASAHFPDSPASYWNLTGKIYNNTFYSQERGKKTILMLGRPEHMEFYNNLIYAEAGVVEEIPCSNPENLFRSNNCYYFGNSPVVPVINEEGAIIGKNPNLVAGGTGKTGIDTLEGYKLFEDSPCIGAGVPIENNGGYDYFGNAISETPNIGAYEGSGISYDDEKALELAKTNSVHMKVNSTYMTVNGEEQAVDQRSSDAALYIKNDTTMVPVRSLAEALDCEIEWRYETRSTMITGVGGTLEFSDGDIHYDFDGITREWSQMPEIIDNILYVPLRDICRVMGKQLIWKDGGDIYITDNTRLYQ